MNLLLNPYIAGAPVVEPSMFFGRHDVFEWIEHSLAGKYVNHILVIHGQRRVGKTSVLKQIPNFLPKSYIQVFFDLQGRTSTSLDRFLWWMAREISRVLKQEHGLAVPVPEREAFASDPDILLSQFLPALLPPLGERKLLLTFDEFDTLEQPEIRETLARPLIQYLRRMFELENLSFIFSIGSSGHKLENMQASYTDFFKTALYRKISFLSQADCFHLITKPVTGMLEYAPDAIERIYAVTAGHPYFTQLVCHELFSMCQKTGQRTLAAADVDGILDDVIERGTVNLKFTWDEAAGLEKWIMACLAQADAPASPAALRERLREQRVRYSDPDLNAALIHLRDKDILSDDSRFVVYLLQRWLRKNRPLDRVREELVEVNPIANRYIEIGEEYRALGQAAKAIESFQQALAVDPLNLKAQLGMAHAHLDQKEYPAAEQAFEKALGIDDEDVTARTGLCEACLALGEAARLRQDAEGAKGYYRRILEVNREHGEAAQRLAEIFCQQAEAALQGQQENAALAAYQEALKYTPEDESLQGRCAQLQEMMREKAIAAVLEASQKEAAKGQYRAASERLQAGLQSYPGEIRLQAALEKTQAAQHAAELRALREKAERLAATEKWAAALEAWREYLAQGPPDAPQVQEEMQRLEAQRSLAETYLQGQQALDAKDFGRAANLFKKVILVDETYKDGARLLAVAIEGQRKQRPAIRLPGRREKPAQGEPVSMGEGRPEAAGLAAPGVAEAGLVEAGLAVPGSVETGPATKGEEKPGQAGLAAPGLAAPGVAKAEVATPEVAEASAIEAGKPRARLSRRAWLALAGIALLAGLIFVGVRANWGKYLPGWLVGQQLPGTAIPGTPADDDFITEVLEPLYEREPDFADSFEAWNPTWGEPEPGVRDVWVEGGQMVLTPPAGESANLESSSINARNFMLRLSLFFDPPQGLVDPEKFAVVEFDMRGSDEGPGYKLIFELNQAEADRYHWEMLGAEEEYNGETDLLNLGEMNKLTLYFAGDECAVLVNNQMLVHFHDTLHTGSFNRISAHTDQGSIKVIFDDLRFWNLDNLLPTPAPTEASLPTAAVPTPLTPTIAPWIVHFAEPTLERARQAQPSFQDDFSYLRPEWESMGGFSVEEGAAILYAEPGTYMPMLRGAPLNTEAFVLQLDMRVEFPGAADQPSAAGHEPSMWVDLLLSDDEHYTFYLLLNNQPGEATTWNVWQQGRADPLVSGETPAFDAGEWAQLTVIFSEGRLAIYLNDQPLGYVDGLPATSQQAVIGVDPDPSSLVLYIYNLLLWDLNNLAPAGAAEAAPAFLTERAPDYVDEFDSLNPQWTLESPLSRVENGQLILHASNEWAGINGEPLQSRDFQIQYDFQLLQTDSELVILDQGVRCTAEARYGFVIRWSQGRIFWSIQENDGIAQTTRELRVGELSVMDPMAVHQLRLAGIGSQFWFYLDGELVATLQDMELTEGDLCPSVASQDGTAEIAVDNLNLWNLDTAWTWDLPENVQQTIWESPPDFEDDFTTQRPEWQVEGGAQAGLFEWVDGALRIPPAPILTGDGMLRAINYVFQTNLRFSETAEDLEFLYGTRFTDLGNGRATEYIWKLNTLTKEWVLVVNLDLEVDNYIELLRGQVNSLEAGEWEYLTVVVNEDRLWLYWNEELEVDFQGLELAGEINRFVLSPESGNPYFELDNWKFWNLR